MKTRKLTLTLSTLTLLLCQMAMGQQKLGKPVNGKSNVPESVNPEDPTIGYNPLTIPNNEIETREFVVPTDGEREIPILVYFPAVKTKAPVVIHSHGLGGQKETSPFLANHWAARGYVAIFLQHPGSDNGVWEGLQRRQIRAAMKKAASSENLVLRVNDVKLLLNQLEAWNELKDHPLYKRLDLENIGVSGHSFGARTAQIIGGQSNRTGPQADDRVKAVIPISPSVPRFGNANRAFSDVSIPWLCITGTQDSSMVDGVTPESRRKVFEALPAENKFELVLHDANHNAFTEAAQKPNPRRVRRNPNHHQAVKSLTTAFWDVYLKKDEAAKQWLNDKSSVRSVLEERDLWQSK